MTLLVLNFMKRINPTTINAPPIPVNIPDNILRLCEFSGIFALKIIPSTNDKIPIPINPR